LATSTQRFAVNTGFPTSKDTVDIFRPRAEAINLRELNSFLTKLKPPSFTPWTDVLSIQEISEYQRCKKRKFPLLHLIPKGLSLSHSKGNKLKGNLFPIFKIDYCRCLLKVRILTAGRRYGRST